MGGDVSRAFNELVDELKALEPKLDGLDDLDRLDGYKWIFSILQVATDTQVWADKGRPRFVDIVGRSRDPASTTSATIRRSGSASPSCARR